MSKFTVHFRRENATIGIFGVEAESYEAAVDAVYGSDDRTKLPFEVLDRFDLTGVGEPEEWLLEAVFDGDNNEVWSAHAGLK